MTFMSRSDKYRGVRHPFWWVALALLLLNDHLFKGAGWFPASLTGKLSDLSGLVVAPILLSTLLRVRTAGARGLVYATVAVAFSAINTLEPAARLVEHFTSAVGLPWRIWRDNTDLYALAVLPIAWWVDAPSRRPSAEPASRTFWRREWIEKLAVMLGGLACVATSLPEVEEVYPEPPLVINWHSLPVVVLVERLSDTACRPPEEMAATAFKRSDFKAWKTVELSPGEVMPVSIGSPHAGDVDALPACNAVRVRMWLDDGPELAVWLDESNRLKEPRSLEVIGYEGGEPNRFRVADDDDWAFDRAVTIEGPADNRQLFMGDLLEPLAVDPEESP